MEQHLSPSGWLVSAAAVAYGRPQASTCIHTRPCQLLKSCLWTGPGATRSGAAPGLKTILHRHAALPGSEPLIYGQVQALRAVEQHLGLEKLYVMGTNCVDNGPRQGLQTFLQAASSKPDTVLHYEFMQVRLEGQLDGVQIWGGVRGVGF